MARQQFGGQGRVGLGHPGHLGAAADISRRAAAGQPGQPRGTQCASGFCAYAADQAKLQQRGQQPRPPGTAAAAAHQGQRLDARAIGTQCLPAVQQAKAHPFQHRVAQRGGLMGLAEAKKHTLCLGVVVWRALTTQVGQEEGCLGALPGIQAGDLLDQRGFVGLAQQLGHPAQRAGGAEHHAHLVPGVGQGVAKGMHGARRVGAEALVAQEDHTRGAQRQKALTRLHRAHAHRAGGVVAGAAGNDHARRQTPARGERRFQRGAGRAALDQAWHVALVQTGQGQGLGGPPALRHVQPQRAGRVTHVTDMLSTELQAQPVLGQQHGADPGEQRGLVLTHPGQLGRREAWHGQVAGDGGQRWAGRHHLGALCGAAAIVPQDGRAQDLVLGVQRHGAVHLPRQADALDPAQFAAMVQLELRHGCLQRCPPLGGLLFTPQGLWPLQAQGHTRCRNDVVPLVQQQELEFGCAEVDAEEHGVLQMNVLMRFPGRAWRPGRGCGDGPCTWTCCAIASRLTPAAMVCPTLPRLPA
jgi:hypothetical protein